MKRFTPFLVVTIACCTAALTDSCYADFILSPDRVIENTMGKIGTGYEIEKVINQVGLEANPFVSGVTDFDAYINSDPRHLTETETSYWVSELRDITGYIDLDLGGAFTVNRFALWQAKRLGLPMETRQFSLFLSNDPDFSDGTVAAGTFVALPFEGNPTKVQVFDLDAAATENPYQFVRLQIHGSYGAICSSMGEVAFSVVPEPSTIAMWSVFAGLGCVHFWRRRKK